MKVKQNQNVGIFKIAATYIGTIVGAGFASGQEVLQYFVSYGIVGIIGIIISTFLFFFFGYTILVLGRKLNADSHDDILLYSNGKIFGTIIDVIVTIFLFGALAAMIAGSGAIIKQQFQISPLFGSVFMSLITLLTVIKGTESVINAISFVVPLLLSAVLFVCIYSIINNTISSEEIEQAKRIAGPTPNWFISAINYASYNIVIAIAVLGPLGVQAKSKSRLLTGALLGALGLGIGVVAIYYSILTNINEVQTLEVPMIAIAKNIAKVVQVIFAIVLIAEVYTTAVGNLYGFVNRFTFIGKKYRFISVLITTIFAFLLAQIGFSSIVKYVYPAVGYGGLLLFIGLIYTWIFKRKDFNGDNS